MIQELFQLQKPSLNINDFGLLISKLKGKGNRFHLFDSIRLEFSTCIWVLYDRMCSIQ